MPINNNNKIKIIYSCSGASDVGEIADMTARQLRSDGFAKMSCLAAIGGTIPNYLQSAKEADEIITIDGCQVSCAKKIFEQIGVIPQSHILTDMGLEKGKTDPVQEIVDKMCSAIKNINK